MLISIVIPIYNTKPEFIQECLDSTNLLKHEANITNYEVILINDGSTNKETLQFLENIKATNYNHYQIINKENGGLSSARNAGIAIAKGKYIFPLDSDDKVNHNIKYFIEYLHQDSDAEIIFGDLSIFGDKIEYHKLRPFYPSELWLFNNKLCACSIYTKDIWQKVNGYDETFKTCEDWDFWCRCASVGAKFHYLPYPNYDYRIINNGQSMFQTTQDLIPMYHKKTLEKLPMSLINKDEMTDFINDSFRKQLHQKRRKALGIFIYAYFPKLFYWLCKKGLFSYKDRFIQL